MNKEKTHEKYCFRDKGERRKKRRRRRRRRAGEAVSPGAGITVSPVDSAFISFALFVSPWCCSDAK